MNEFVSNNGRQNIPDPEKAREFFMQEERDWNLVRQAAGNGDIQAYQTLRIFRLIEAALDKLWKTHDDLIQNMNGPATPEQREKDCNRIMDEIGQFTLQRVKVLYEDFRIQDKRESILKMLNSKQAAPTIGPFSIN